MSIRIRGLLAGYTLWYLILGARALTPERQRSSRTRVRREARLSRRAPSSYPEEGGGSPTGSYLDEISSFSLSRAVDRPTQTLTKRIGAPVIPEKPKIVVLGASGRIGRLVVRHLLESGQKDLTIVAFCRDYDKACRVLYDDVVLSRHESRQNGNKGPTLQIVQGDLVPPEELPGFVDTEHSEWLQRAESAAAFYNKKVEDYDDGDDTIIDSNEALEQAIRGCTAIVSCVGSVRPTQVWTDWVVRPLIRLLRSDVRSWCQDARHPYYVTYASTRKTLALAEREQVKRQIAAMALIDEEEEKNSIKSKSLKQDSKKKSTPERIRFVRISDLCVSQQPWHLIPLLTNALYSMVFRYHDMAERLLESSALIDTVVLRPGDLTDDERDLKTASLQVDASGKVPCPARVGRDDVAALAVAACMFDSKATDDSRNDNQQQQQQQNGVDEDSDESFHYTLGVRWASQDMGPYPAQGHMKHGLPTAQLCMMAALKTLRRNDRRKRRRKVLNHKQLDPASIAGTASSSALVPIVRRRTSPIKPWASVVAVPVYVLLTLMIKSLFRCALPYLPGRSWIIPAANRASAFVSMTLKTFLLGHVANALRILSSPQRWPRFFSRRATQKYISL